MKQTYILSALSALLSITFGALAQSNLAPDKAGIGITQNWNIDEWINDTRSEYSYIEIANDECLLTQVHYYEWDNGDDDWTIEKRYTYTYDSDFRLATWLNESVGDTEDSWILDVQKVYSYDQDGNLILVVTSDYSGSEWEPVTQEIFEYNSENLVITDYAQYWDTSLEEWVNETRQQYEYNADTKVVYYDYSSWNPGPEEWEFSFKREYEYALSSIVQNNFLYVFGDWLLSSRKTTTLNEFDRPLQDLTEAYDSQSEFWFPTQQVDYNYEEGSGFLIERTTSVVNSGNQTTDPIFRVLYSEHCILVGQSEHHKQPLMFSIMGNPSNELRLGMISKKPELVEIRITDVTGNIISNQKIQMAENNIIEIPTGTYSIGTYMISMITSQGLENHRWVKH
jgi:hypothetical protein